ncbi:MAG: FAD-dependent oxidoreductase [Phycicoccus sp.]|nr:FAD-dependent oxidoreductase [Phycicoccus sp.]NMM34031.1 FAD-dependent oxidoreductase [Phycicoccus sp.]
MKAVNEAPTPITPARPSVAVIGSGVSGLTAAYLLNRTHDVTLFEADSRLGGHAHTHDLTASDGSEHAVDSGFIVHNDRTYPWLRKLFAELDVEVRPTEMSMSVRCEDCGLEYAGGRGLKGMLAQPRRLLDPQFLRMLLQVKRFHRRATAFLKSAEGAQNGDTNDSDDLTTYGEFLEREGFSEHFVAHYAVPVVSCVWSSGREVALLYPARYLFRFLDHHGMLRLTGSPQWYTVAGGSRTYVERLAARLPDVRRSAAVTDVTRRPDGVEIRTVTGAVTRFDRVVIATHADQALGLLTDPSDQEVQTLKAFGYSRNETVLHTDASVLPDATEARASWNYRMSSCALRDEPTVVTYWMNRLQGHTSPQEYLVTLNAREHIDPESVLAVMDYEHPIFTPESVAAQSHLAALATDQTVYAGAYHGWGFHEDGCRSGVDAARHFGVTW